MRGNRVALACVGQDMRKHMLASSLAAVLIAACGSADAGTTTSGPPSCAEITRFAEQLVDIGITYDYEPTDSPGELAALVDVVFAGVLTGGFESGAGQSGEFVSYGIEVTEVATGADVVAEGDEVYVSVDYNRAVTQPAEYEEAVAVGAPVVVFADAGTDGRALVASVPEGFMTACDGEQPIGWYATYGDWPSIESLDDVLRLAAE